jgi:hypothetical protein
MKAYINSYLPQDPKIREIRWQGILQQKDWLKKINATPHYIATNWFDEEEKVAENYGSVERHTSLSFIEARRIQMDLLCNSNDDWGLLLDDDSILDERTNLGIFQQLDKLTGIDLFCARSKHIAIGGGFKRAFEDKWASSRFRFERTTAFKGSFMVCRNTKKFYNKIIHAPSTIQTGEDVALAFKFIENNLGAYMCLNIVLEELGVQGTWMNRFNRERNDWKKEFADHFQDIELVNGNLECKRFYNKHFSKSAIEIDLNVSDIFEF